MTTSIKEITMEQVRQYNPVLYEQIRNSVDPEKAIGELNEKLTAAEESNEKLTEKNTQLETDLEKITTERDELKAKVDEFEVQEKVSEKRETISKLIDEAKAPKELFSEDFVEMLVVKMDDEEEIKTAISDRVSIYDKGKGKVTDSGEEHLQEGDKEKGDLTEEEVLDAVKR
jgi:septal ring factor EnvC (AmiA/AmiB activator)